MKFRDEILEPVLRHWMCGQGGCAGEMKSVGHGQHLCNGCGRKAQVKVDYPRVFHMIVEGNRSVRESRVWSKWGTEIDGMTMKLQQ